MTDRILRRAASLLSGPENYTRYPADSVFDPRASKFSATGLLERANTTHPQGALVLRRGSASELADAKARVCRAVGHPHIDAWEHAVRPDWRLVRDALEAA